MTVEIFQIRDRFRHFCFWLEKVLWPKGFCGPKGDPFIWLKIDF